MVHATTGTHTHPGETLKMHATRIQLTTTHTCAMRARCCPGHGRATQRWASCPGTMWAMGGPHNWWAHNKVSKAMWHAARTYARANSETGLRNLRVSQTRFCNRAAVGPTRPLR